MSRQIPTEIKSGAKIFKNIYFTDLIVIFVYWMGMDTFKGGVHPLLATFYTIFNLCVGVFLALPSGTNTGRKNWEALLVFAVKDPKTYHPTECEGDEITLGGGYL
jgi:hypothetical protein